MLVLSGVCFNIVTLRNEIRNGNSVFLLSETVRVCVLLGCNLWTRKANTAADNGVFYSITSESECMTECLTSSTCVAFDLTPVGCALHHNDDDLANAYFAPGVTQFVLNRHCLLTSSLSTSSPHTTATSIRSTTGINDLFMC